MSNLRKFTVISKEIDRKAHSSRIVPRFSFYSDFHKSYSSSMVLSTKHSKIHPYLLNRMEIREQVRTRTMLQLGPAKKFPIELGGELEEIEVTWEEFGSGDKIILLIPSLSMGSHACSTLSDPTPGWWEGALGEHKAISFSKYRIICPSILGSPFGTTSPITLNPVTSKPYGPSFPVISTVDQVRCLKMFLDHIGITSVHAIVGASLGGMQALTFASEFPLFVERVVAICCTGKSSPGTVAFRRVQRLAIMSDPEYKDGYYEPGKGPFKGLAIARELGTICYRSREEFNTRFDWNPESPFSPQHTSFQVEKYLAAQADRFSHHYDANCYLILSRCMDLMDLGRGFPNYCEGVKRIKAKALIIAFEKDILIPIDEAESLAKLLHLYGNEVQFEHHSSLFGHDAFLKEFDWMNSKISKFLDS